MQVLFTRPRSRGGALRGHCPGQAGDDHPPSEHEHSAPFERNDQMLDVLPIGGIAFPGTGIQENLADKAKKLGIAVWEFGGA